MAEIIYISPPLNSSIFKGNLKFGEVFSKQLCNMTLFLLCGLHLCLMIWH